MILFPYTVNKEINQIVYSALCPTWTVQSHYVLPVCDCHWQSPTCLQKGSWQNLPSSALRKRTNPQLQQEGSLALETTNHWITQWCLPILPGTILKREGEREEREKLGEDRWGEGEEQRERCNELQNYRIGAVMTPSVSFELGTKTLVAWTLSTGKAWLSHELWTYQLKSSLFQWPLTTY